MYTCGVCYSFLYPCNQPHSVRKLGKVYVTTLRQLCTYCVSVVFTLYIFVGVTFLRKVHDTWDRTFPDMNTQRLRSTKKTGKLSTLVSVYTYRQIHDITCTFPSMRQLLV
jgi:hypothetical protein